MLNEHRNIQQFTKFLKLCAKKKTALWKKFFARFGFLDLEARLYVNDVKVVKMLVLLLKLADQQWLCKIEHGIVPKFSKTSCISCLNKFLMTSSFRPIMAWINARYSYQVRANEFVSQISPCARSQQQPQIPQAPPNFFLLRKKNKYR